ncbi:sensor histidine kinase [Streptacidiphilus sp. P02-A3a]|uniref:sensor histidine kinase n=1 Tax=Streptacidiphilus sp. P02-A3a TaxID=2704468 RepID=UPI0015F99C00|nr:histidine kinase [Streptacidiphilus sp. P02-A3a]QMU71216.1 sensor histidine kinase [Streptacidiphilus sp. P02-A3a]
MIRSLTGRWAHATISADVSSMVNAVRLLVLVVVLVTVPLAEPRLGVGARGVAMAVAFGVAGVSWVVWLLAAGRERLTVSVLAVMGAAGGAMAGLAPLSTAVAVGCVVTSAAGIRLNPETSLAIVAETVAAFLTAGLVSGAPVEALLGYPLTFAGLWVFGLIRHDYLLRAEQAEGTLAETRRMREAETQAAALAERARIAREIHDVLAHSLAAVSVNLQAAEGLLAALPDESPELLRAIECVGRAGALTRQGMADARSAILALREDLAPLADQLSALADEGRADGDAAVGLQVTGAPRPVTAEVGLAAFRAAQEALTNARKHAPGQPVSLALEFEPTRISVRVANPLPAAGRPGPLAPTGAGYGLTGLRERAALGGGTLSAGPVQGEWRVCLTMPT